jgi:CRISPR-associated protein Cas2
VAVKVTGYRAMWVFAMFDLPTDTKKARRDYTRFRHLLIEDGFTMLQYSVYARPCPSEENANVHYLRIKAGLPPQGQVRVMVVTDKQYERMKVFYGKKRIATEKPPDQLAFF